MLLAHCGGAAAFQLGRLGKEPCHTAPSQPSDGGRTGHGSITLGIFGYVGLLAEFRLNLPEPPDDVARGDDYRGEPLTHAPAER